MKRQEALEHLLQGGKIVSYFGFEYELTKHGVQCTAPEGEQDSFLPLSDSCSYSLAGAAENPYEHGTADWARWEFEHGRTVRAPSGQVYTETEWAWYQDLLAKGWTVE